MPMPLDGLAIPVLTLFGGDGSIDAGKNAAFARRLSERGADHLFLLGSMGEFASIDPRERGRLLESVIESVTGRTDVWVGCGAPSTRAAVAFAEEAESLGAAALVAVPPYYLHPPLEAVERYYRALRAATSVPLLAYDIPGLVGYALPARLLHRLGKEGILAGAKETSGTWSAVEALLAGRPDGFGVFPGDDALASRAILSGAAGAVMGTANVAPRLAGELVRAARAQDRGRATELQSLVDDLARVLSTGPFPATAKFLLGKFSHIDAGYRPPIDLLSDGEAREVLAALAPLEARLAPHLAE
jgi:dihydrodipicolinate synthase/N-acetylneuraminate lyase